MNQLTSSIEWRIGAFEAKAQLSPLLRAVEQGERFTITVRGKPVADISAAVAVALPLVKEFDGFGGSYGSWG
jgi:antitoxin (DNA-binding transcriptional repressor) of toxin-antitoxin stability system